MFKSRDLQVSAFGYLYRTRPNHLQWPSTFVLYVCYLHLLLSVILKVEIQRTNFFSFGSRCKSLFEANISLKHMGFTHETFASNRWMACNNTSYRKLFYTSIRLIIILWAIYSMQDHNVASFYKSQSRIRCVFYKSCLTVKWLHIKHKKKSRIVSSIY